MSRAAASTLLLCLAGVVMALVGAVLFFPFLVCGCSTKHGARGAASLSNAKQLGTALLIYAQDHDALLPPAEIWASAVRDIVNDDGVFNDPSSLPMTRYGFAFYKPLGLVDTSRVLTPSQVPMVFQTRYPEFNAHGDFSLLPKEPRHGGADIICTADGSARMRKREWLSDMTPLRLKPDPVSGGRGKPSAAR